MGNRHHEPVWSMRSKVEPLHARHSRREARTKRLFVGLALALATCTDPDAPVPAGFEPDPEVGDDIEVGIDDPEADVDDPEADVDDPEADVDDPEVGADPVVSDQVDVGPNPDEGIPACTLSCSPEVRESGWTQEELEEHWTYRAVEQVEERYGEQAFVEAAELSSREVFDQWRERAEERLRNLLRVRAEQWPDVPLLTRFLAADPFEGYTRFRIDYLVAPGQRIPAYLYVTADLAEPGPAILFWHGHSAWGKDGPAGETPEEEYHHAAARQLAEAGYVVLAPDVRSFGETGLHGVGGWPDHVRFTEMLLMHGRVAMGVFLADAYRALDVLESLPEVDPERIGVAGVSLGGQIALLLAVTDPRISAAVVNGAFGSYRTTHLYTSHDICQYVPGVADWLDFADWATLAAPTPLLLVTGNLDPVFPPDDVVAAHEQIAEAYRLLGAEDEVALEIHPGKHEWVQQPALDWLDDHLR